VVVSAGSQLPNYPSLFTHVGAYSVPLYFQPRPALYYVFFKICFAASQSFPDPSLLSDFFPPNMSNPIIREFISGGYSPPDLPLLHYLLQCAMFSLRDVQLLHMLKDRALAFLQTYDQSEVWKYNQLSLCVVLAFEPCDLELLYYNLLPTRFLRRMSIPFALLSAGVKCSSPLVSDLNNCLDPSGSISYFKASDQDLITYFNNLYLDPPSVPDPVFVSPPPRRVSLVEKAQNVKPSSFALARIKRHKKRILGSSSPVCGPVP